ncbi:hypothetical protein CWI38_1034p0020 [Hamiltosporidium tvaerminnensis]|uniref:Uncharacterized protein n=1 Tax=Hamiltosporidium tvaerminnensis TaxID=1176355 RepID=A0A4Q9LT65_9MICR|nr:hypothetical protein CWI38_1034p0020 [Hamiltosporidium tvaerminnensis]
MNFIYFFNESLFLVFGLSFVILTELSNIKDNNTVFCNLNEITETFTKDLRKIHHGIEQCIDILTSYNIFGLKFDISNSEKCFEKILYRIEAKTINKIFFYVVALDSKDKNKNNQFINLFSLSSHLYIRKLAIFVEILTVLKKDQVTHYTHLFGHKNLSTKLNLSNFLLKFYKILAKVLNQLSRVIHPQKNTFLLISPFELNLDSKQALNIYLNRSLVIYMNMDIIYLETKSKSENNIFSLNMENKLKKTFFYEFYNEYTFISRIIKITNKRITSPNFKHNQINYTIKLYRIYDIKSRYITTRPNIFKLETFIKQHTSTDNTKIAIDSKLFISKISLNFENNIIKIRLSNGFYVIVSLEIKVENGIIVFSFLKRHFISSDTIKYGDITDLKEILHYILKKYKKIF